LSVQGGGLAGGRGGGFGVRGAGACQLGVGVAQVFEVGLPPRAAARDVVVLRRAGGLSVAGHGVLGQSAVGVDGLGARVEQRGALACGVRGREVVL
jgi:hypothetical protein